MPLIDQAVKVSSTEFSIRATFVVPLTIVRSGKVWRRKVIKPTWRHRMQTLYRRWSTDKNTTLARDQFSKKCNWQTSPKIGVNEGECSSLPAHFRSKILRWPTLFTPNVIQSSRINEEIFGPVLRFRHLWTAERSIGESQQHSVRLSEACGPIKVFKISKVTSALCAGVVWQHYNKFDPTSPFGGYKEKAESGREGLHVASCLI